MDTARNTLTKNEMIVLRDTLHRWRQKKVSWLMDRFGYIEHTLTQLYDMSSRRKIVKFYEDGFFQGILAFDIGHVWWTPHLVCTEVFVLAVDGVHGLQRHAAAELERIAESYGASLIITGNMFQENNALIGNGYKKYGYQQECSTYVKEVTT